MRGPNQPTRVVVRARFCELDMQSNARSRSFPAFAGVIFSPRLNSSENTSPLSARNSARGMACACQRPSGVLTRTSSPQPFSSSLRVSASTSSGEHSQAQTSSSSSVLRGSRNSIELRLSYRKPSGSFCRLLLTSPRFLGSRLASSPGCTPGAEPFSRPFTRCSSLKLFNIFDFPFGESSNAS